ncbi:hypothetical protein ABN764_12320 [Paenibacillaceae sp. P-4]|uniref:hypothetical protein n=1 Tax=Paenibacillaceae bacterium P-4 TaxID=3160969 RepID=UPI00158122E3
MNNNGSWSGGCIGLAVLLAMMLVLFRWLVTDGLLILLLIALFVVGYVIVQMSKSQKAAQDLAEEHMKQKEKIALRLAAELGGYITAAEIAVHSEMTLDEAAQILDRLKSQGVCTLRIADNGTYVYQFESLLNDRQKRQSERI